MSDPPPPYQPSDNSFAYARYVGRTQNDVPIPMQTHVRLPTDVYTVRHNVCISVVTFQDVPSDFIFNKDETRRSINTVHFWTPRNSSPTFAPILGDVEADLLPKVRGFQNRGSFGLSGNGMHMGGTEHFRELVPEQLARFPQDSGNSDTLFDPIGDCTAASSSEMGPKWYQRNVSGMSPSCTVSQHASSANPSDLKPNISFEDGNSPMVHVYKIHMFSKAAKIDPTHRQGLHLLFKWAKSHSAYGPLRGFWETKLIDVINDGMLGAGDQLTLLVRGVSDSQMEDLRERWKEGTRIL